MAQKKFLSFDKLTLYDSNIKAYVEGLVNNLRTVVNGKADSSHVHSAATQSANGFMSSGDKTKLDGIATGANKTVVDSSLSSSSTNPVQNKVINSALSGKASSSHTHSEYAASNHSHTGYASTSHSHSNYAPLNSPALIGTPTAPTADKWDSSTQIATTAFVKDMGAGDNLYYNASGTTGTITLSDSIANYVYVGIKYTDNGTRMYYKEVPTYGNSLVTVLDRSISSGSAMYISSTTLTFSGTSVTQSAVGMLSHNNGTTSEYTTSPVTNQQFKVVGIWGKVYDDGI